MRRRRTRLITTLAAAILLVPTPVSAQNATLRIAFGDSATVIAGDRSHGYNAFPATPTFSALGAALETTPRGLRVRLDDDTLTFETLSPIFHHTAGPRQLAAPVYRHDGEIYIPGQLFTDWLPAARPELVRYENGTLRLLKPLPREAHPTVAGKRDTNGDATRASTARGQTPATKPRNSGRKRTRDAGASTRVVIIDPGHGGRDPGKIGPGGIREKDLTLAIARRLAEELRKRGGFEVHLTRTSDTLVALADRPHMANRWKGNRPAALFISIHANSAANRNARGFETFFLSDARTEDERRVAEMENAAIAYESPDSTAPKNDLDWIFNTLRNDFYVRASNDLAELIQQRLATVHPGPNRGVKQAGFRVLVGAFMPAVLVETAFISNRQEASLLRDAAFQRKIAGALADAVERFFASHEHLWATDEVQADAEGSR